MSGQPKAVILTALPVEYQAIRSHLTDLQEDVHRMGTVYEKGVFHGYYHHWEMGIVEIGPGNEGAAMEAERAIEYYEPDIALFVGVAGGLKDVTIGDVVAATKVCGYESAAAKDSLEPRPNVAETSYKLEQRARAEARKIDWISRRLGAANSSSPSVFVGPIAAGEKVLKSNRSAIREFLRANYGDALAVEMEGRGFLKATHACSVDAMVIRGISDLIDHKGEADASGSQKLASRNAAAFALEILANIKASNVNHVNPCSSRNSTPPTDEDWWKRLMDIALTAYPKGPAEMSIWSRAGGDMSALDLNSPGRAMWFMALRKLRQFQDLGHKILFLIGDFTAQIGDPSGRDQKRPKINKSDIKKNTYTCKKTIGKKTIAIAVTYVGGGKYQLAMGGI